MRMIDADALKDRAEIIPLTFDGGIDINDFEKMLDEMPTVDAIPVEWLENFRDGLGTLSENRLMAAIDLIIDAYRVEKKRNEE